MCFLIFSIERVKSRESRLFQSLEVMSAGGVIVYIYIYIYIYRERERERL